MVKVSIIIPVYNVEAYIRQCLDSVINQTLKDIEAICVDDCSPDGSGKILDEYAARDSRIKVFHLEKNGGPGVARNIALEKAQGKYIMFLDPDDWYELNACELAYNQIEKNQNDMVFFGMRLYDDKKNCLQDDKYRLSGFLQYIDNQHINLSEVDTPFLKTTEMVYRIYSKKFLDVNNIGFGGTHCGEDCIFAMKTISCARDVSILNVPLYNYRINNEKSMTHNTSKWCEHMESRYFVYQYLKSEASKNVVRAWIVQYIGSLVYWYGMYSQQDRKNAKNVYNQMRKVFIELNQNHDIRSLKKYINYANFKRVVKNPWWKYRLISFMQRIFLLKNSPDKRHKIVTILGLKIKIKKQ